MKNLNPNEGERTAWTRRLLHAKHVPVHQLKVDVANSGDSLLLLVVCSLRNMHTKQAWNDEGCGQQAWNDEGCGHPSVAKSSRASG